MSDIRKPLLSPLLSDDTSPYSEFSIDQDEPSTVNVVEWINAYSPPTPADLNAERQIENLLTNPLYECFMVNFLNLHEIHKEEKGPKRQRQQRIINGKIDIQVHNLLVLPPLMANLDEEFTFKVFVKREAECLKNVKKLEKGSGKENMYVEGENELPSNTRVQPITSETDGSLNGCQWMISIDLNSVYMTQSGQKVYKLCTAKTNETNKFQLVVRIYQKISENNLVEVAIKESETFIIRSKPRSTGGNRDNGGNGRNGGLQSPPGPKPSKRKLVEHEGPSSSASSSAGSLPSSSRTNSEVEFDKVITKYLQTQRGYIHDLTIVEPIKTDKHDIAYHFKINDPTYKFKKGDVVAFVEGHDGRTVIELLTQDNYRRAKMAGVISRSNYISGQCPDESIEDNETDLVCIIGIVKVKVHGPVRNGEQLYASPRKPGVAVTEATFRLMGCHADIKPFFLAQAIEPKPADDIYDENLVSAFVSITLGIERMANANTMKIQVQKMTDEIESSLKVIGRKFNYKIFFTLFALLLILSGTGLGLWQRYAPNTLYRKAICRHGWIKDSHVCITYKNKWEEVSVHGIEFKYHKLRKKLFRNKHFHKLRGTGKKMHYFINFDRCINMGVTYGNEYLGEGSTIGGPEIIATDCTGNKAFYFVGRQWHNFTRTKSINCFKKDEDLVKVCHRDDD